LIYTVVVVVVVVVASAFSHYLFTMRKKRAISKPKEGKFVCAYTSIILS
jgi:hypothetical protein